MALHSGLSDEDVLVRQVLDDITSMETEPRIIIDLTADDGDEEVEVTLRRQHDLAEDSLQRAEAGVTIANLILVKAKERYVSTGEKLAEYHQRTHNLRQAEAGVEIANFILTKTKELYVSTGKKLAYQRTLSQPPIPYNFEQLVANLESLPPLISSTPNEGPDLRSDEEVKLMFEMDAWDLGDSWDLSDVLTMEDYRSIIEEYEH
jgi:hypothetical protein